jgi:hypothetical protein
LRGCFETAEKGTVGLYARLQKRGKEASPQKIQPLGKSSWPK